MTKTPKGWDEATQEWDDAARRASARPDTRHLDTALEIFKSDKAKRAKGTPFNLEVFPAKKPGGPVEAVLTGPRGKTIATYYDTPAEVKKKAQAHADRVGLALTIHE